MEELEIKIKDINENNKNIVKTKIKEEKDLKKANKKLKRKMNMTKTKKEVMKGFKEIASGFSSAFSGMKQAGLFQIDAKEDYETFLQMYDDSKIGTFESAVKNGETYAVAHTENGPIIAIAKNLKYGTCTTYQGFFPVVEDGVEVFRYGKFTATYSDEKGATLTGAVKKKIGFAPVNLVKDELRNPLYHDTDKVIHGFRWLEEKFISAAKEVGERAPEVIKNRTLSKVEMDSISSMWNDGQGMC